MAKQLVNPFERHIDKAILGLTVLVLIGAVARFLVTSPNQLDLGGEAVSPSTIDRKVVMAAQTARDRVRNAQSTVDPVDPLYGEFETTMNPFDESVVANTLPAAVRFGTDVPLVDVLRAADSAELVQVAPLSPDPPVAIHGRSMFFLDNSDKRTALNWVTLSGTFNVKEQMENQGSEYGAARKEVTFGPLEVQRRARRADGSWSDDDWIVIETTPRANVPRLPKITLLEDQDRPFVPRSDLVDIEAFLERLSKQENQVEIIRPLMHRWVPGAGDAWAVSKIAPEEEVKAMDAFYQDLPTNRYGEDEFAAAEEIPPAERLAQGERDLATAWKNKSVEGATLVFNMALTLEEDPNVGAATKNRAIRLKDQANLKIADIQRWINRMGGPKKGDDPDAVTKTALPFQQLWAHDAELGSVKSGTTYQYRVRPLIFNRLAGEPTKFREKTNALVVFIPGEWSQPVEVEVPADTHYWVTGEDPRNKRVNVEIYRWAEGVWTKSDRFKLGIGEKVAGDSRHDLPPWEIGGEPENALVQFDAGVSVVDIDFKRRLRERKKGKSRDGVRFAAARDVCSVVLKDDATGKLYERFVPVDKDDPSKRQIQPYKPPQED